MGPPNEWDRHHHQHNQGRKATEKNPVCSTISGVVLGALITNALDETGDSEGLLYGSVRHETKVAVSDFGEGTSESSTHIEICAFVATGSRLSFYGPTGQVDCEVLARLTDERSTPSALAETKPEIIGWYSSRRGMPMRASARELAVTRSLAEWISEPRKGAELSAPTHLVLGLVSSYADGPTEATHTYEYRFMHTEVRSAGRPLRSLPARIGNSGHSSAAEYSQFTARHWVPSAASSDGASFTDQSDQTTRALEQEFASALASLEEEAMKAYAITMERHRLEAALEDARREVGVSERI